MVKYCSKCGALLAAKTVDGQQRQACSSGCGHVHWNNPTPVVAALVKVGEEFILARNSKWPAGLFSLISGFLEAGERPESAVAREVQEELGLSTTQAVFVGHYPFPQMNQIILAYMVEAYGSPVPSEEISEIRTLGYDALKAFDFGPLLLGKAVVRDWMRLQ
jgi:NAD+ diphosphatase